MPTRPHIFDLTADEFEALVSQWGMARFRARQVLNWVYQRGVIQPHRMGNLSKADRTTLEANLSFVRGRVSAEQQASDGTEKLLLDWDVASIDNPNSLPVLGARHDTAQRKVHQTECVMIPAVSRESGRQRRTACISSQVGCPVGCHFCASGMGGLDANLTAGQIVEQAWRLAHLSSPGQARHAGSTNQQPKPPGAGLTNIVFMGMGEPLANFKQVTRAIRTLTADWGLNLSPRRITLSTVGLPAPIGRLADQDLGVTLAISLHAPNDALRREIIPWADFVTIDQLVDAGGYYFEKTGREITLEYILLGGLNDQPHHGRELAQVAKRLRSNINLIRYNEVADLPYRRPSDPDVHRFQAILRDAGINTHVRASRGRDIAAACGQLRHEKANSSADSFAHV